MSRQEILSNISVELNEKEPFQTTDKNMTRFAKFRDLFGRKFSTILKLGILMFLFCLPIFVVLIFTFLAHAQNSSMLPYSGNVGIGYPVIVNVNDLAAIKNFSTNNFYYPLFIPAVAIAFIGLGGLFYAIKRLVWDDSIFVLSTFFSGIKKHGLKFFLIGIIFGLFAFLGLFNTYVYEYYHVSLVGKVFGIIATCIVLLVLLMASVFMMTQVVAYKVNFFVMIKNSFLFAILLFLPNFIIIVLSFLPIVILGFIMQAIPQFGMILFMFGMLIFFGYLALIFTLYSHGVFERFITPRTKVYSLAEYTDAKEDVSTDSVGSVKKEKNKKQVVKYKNPKKTKNKDV